MAASAGRVEASKSAAELSPPSVGGGELVHLEAQHVQLVLAAVSRHLFTARAQRDESVVFTAVGGEVDSAPLVDRRPLETLAEQILARAGTVHVHEAGAELPQLRDRHRLFVDPRAGAPFARHRAPDDVTAEHSLDLGLLRAIAHDVGAGARAQRKVERAHEHALAGAGFAGDHVETGSKRNLCRLNNGEVPDCKFLQHRKSWSGRWESNPRKKLGKLLFCH